jgi:hypothetical protein
MVFFMNKSNRHILIKILILVPPFLLIWVCHFIAFDEHKRGIGNKHQQFDELVGIVLVSIVCCLIWCITCIIDSIKNETKIKVQHKMQLYKR